MTNIIIPSSPEDRAAINSAVKEIDGAMTRIAAERDFIGDTLTALTDKVQVPKKILRKLAVAYHKQNMNEAKTELEDVEALYETVIK